MKKVMIAAAVIGSFGLGVGATLISRPALAEGPEITMKTEAKAHPNIVKAIREMQEALREMDAAPDDFGGNKAAAIADTKKAIHSLKKALYFRLKMDDAAIDKAQ